MDVSKQEYLIPANSKRGMLILSIYRPIDLGIVITGGVITFLLFFLLGVNTFTAAILELLPLSVCAFLTLPVPNYHNVLVLIREIISYFKGAKKLEWKGWCVYDDASK